jgi:MFS family permease
VCSVRSRFFYGWVIVAGAWLTYMLNQAAFTWGFSIFVNPLAEEFGWSRTSITVAWVLALGWGLVLGPWLGRIFDRYGPRRLMAMGGALGGLGWILIPTATNYWTFLAYLVLLVGSGINGALGPSIGSAAIAQWFRIRRSLALGVYFTGSGGAGLLLIPGMSALAQMHGWQTSAASLGVLTLVLTVSVAPFMRHKPEQCGLVPDGSVVPKTGEATRRAWDIVKRLPFPKHRAFPEREYALSEALRSTPFWLFTGAIFLRYFGMGITQVHQIPHMLDQGISPAVATAALSVSLVVNIPSRVAVGWMGDHYSKKWLLNVLALVGALALCAFALASPALTVLVWIYAVFWGIGLAMLPLQAAWIADHYGRKSYGAINATSNSLALSGRVAGALAAALAFDYFDSYEQVMFFGAAGFVVGAALLSLLPSPDRVQSAEKSTCP